MLTMVTFMIKYAYIIALCRCVSSMNKIDNPPIVESNHRMSPNDYRRIFRLSPSHHTTQGVKYTNSCVNISRVNFVNTKMWNNDVETIRELFFCIETLLPIAICICLIAAPFAANNNGLIHLSLYLFIYYIDLLVTLTQLSVTQLEN